MSIFATSNASQISKLVWKRNAMVTRLLDWNYNISCLIIGFSRSPMLKLGGVANLKAGLRQFASMELGKLWKQRPTTVVPKLPSLKSCFYLNTFFVAHWLSIALNCAKSSLDCTIAFLVPSSLEMLVLKSFKTICSQSFKVSSWNGEWVNNHIVNIESLQIVVGINCVIYFFTL
jgi:hypothetical protein